MPVRLTLSFLLQLFRRNRLDAQDLPLAKIGKAFGTHRGAIEWLIFGDSVAERISRFDSDPRPLYQMMQDTLASPASAYAITHSAYNVKIYYLYLRLLCALGMQPNRIVLPLNLRSFSPQWYLNPLFQCATHVDSMLGALRDKGVALDASSFRSAALRPFLRIRLTYPMIGEVSIAEIQNILRSNPTTEQDRIRRKRLIFSFHYLNETPGDHPLLELLEALVDFCQQQGIGVSAYFTPVNHWAGNKYLGEQFAKVIEANVQTAARRLRAVSYADYSLSAAPGSFFHEDEATEHLSDGGRSRLAQALSERFFHTANHDHL